MQISTCAYLIARVALEGRVTLVRVLHVCSETCMEKQRLSRKYLLQLYSNCCHTEQWQNVAISSTIWRRERSAQQTNLTNVLCKILLRLLVSFSYFTTQITHCRSKILLRSYIKILFHEIRFLCKILIRSYFGNE